MHPHGSVHHPRFSPPGDRPLPWRVFTAFHRTTHTHRQLLAQMMAERAIPPAQALCLRVIGQSDGLTQSELAQMLGVSRPTITVMLQKMEKSSLIERRTDAADQRFTRIYLTDVGRKLHEEMHLVLATFVAQTGGRLSEKDQRELVRLLDLLDGHMTDALEKCPARTACDSPLHDKDETR